MSDDEQQAQTAAEAMALATIHEDENFVKQDEGYYQSAAVRAEQNRYLEYLRETGLVTWSAVQCGKSRMAVKRWRDNDFDFARREDIILLEGQTQYSKVVSDAALGREKFTKVGPNALLALKLAERLDPDLKPPDEQRSVQIDKAIIYNTAVPLPVRLEELPEEE